MGTAIQNTIDIQNTVSISSGSSRNTQKVMNNNDVSAFDNSLNDAVDNSRDNSASASTYSKNQISSVNTRTTKNASDISSADSKKNIVKSTKKISQDDAGKIADDAGTQMVEEIAEELDVSTEDVENAMELLGMSSADLFDSDKLTQLVAQVTGETDTIGIITDESLYSGLQNIINSSNDILQSVSEQLGITQDQLKSVMTDAASNEQTASAEVQPAPDFVLDDQSAVNQNGQLGQDVAKDQNLSNPASDISVVQDTSSQAQPSDITDTNAPEQGMAGQNVQNQEGQAEQGIQSIISEQDTLNSGKVQVQENPEQAADQDEAQQGKPVIIETDQESQSKAQQLNSEESAKEEVNNGFKIQKTASDGTVSEVKIKADDQSGKLVETGNEIISEAGLQSSEKKNAGTNSRNGSDTDSSLLQKSLIEQIMGKSSTGSNPTVEFQNVQTTAAAEDMTNVIDQITDYMKIHMKQDMTSMEIQLHPQSLGNVNVLVSSAKNGQIVAQFTTQNEAVKTAIENQMPMLQQRFEEQGIKVDAVSVTVDNHQMESSLENGNRQQSSDTGETQAAVPHRRIRQIDLNSLENDGTDEEIVDDESRIAAQMMAVNGNTVDYTV